MSEAKQTVKTKVFIEKFGKGTVFSIWEVDENGEKVSKFPRVSMGKAKLKDLLNHWEEVLKFIEKNL